MRRKFCLSANLSKNSHFENKIPSFWRKRENFLKIFDSIESLETTYIHISITFHTLRALYAQPFISASYIENITYTHIPRTEVFRTRQQKSLIFQSPTKIKPKSSFLPTIWSFCFVSWTKVKFHKCDIFWLMVCVTHNNTYFRKDISDQQFNDFFIPMFQTMV